ncbi:HdeD family acid-resistance protein [Xanthomarina sp.]|uniref:HdeD family acid-resistance protein n=1 Tax=Xanthomarina sp. TaxID=1931211 RepID=UPI002CC5C49F|nr:DUF308 domain-containing protein [Xanthomarina sp.]HLV39835.1 DUF308 domain-containing protein [Xanthomarina sp.]
MSTSLLTKVYTNLWWLQIALGIVFIAFGIWIALVPKESYPELSVFFAIAILITGAFEITRAIKNKNYSLNWKWYLFGGLADTIVGVILLANLELTMKLLPILLGAWIVLRGILYIILSLEVRKGSFSRWFVLLFFGILIISMGVLILVIPEFGTHTIVYATSMAFILIGIFRITFGRCLYQYKFH